MQKMERKLNELQQRYEQTILKTPVKPKTTTDIATGYDKKLDQAEATLNKLILEKERSIQQMENAQYSSEAAASSTRHRSPNPRVLPSYDYFAGDFKEKYQTPPPAKRTSVKKSPIMPVGQQYFPTHIQGPPMGAPQFVPNVPPVPYDALFDNGMVNNNRYVPFQPPMPQLVRPVPPPVNRVRQQRGENQDASKVSLPKLPLYDGKGRWKSFLVQFNTSARLRRWNEQAKLDNLCLSLKDSAIDFFDSQPEYVKEDYNLMINKLEQRFGVKDLPETLRLQFYHMKQEQDESLEEWADRVRRLATLAFVDLPAHFMESEIVRRFCQGCLDKETAQYAADRLPTNIEEALRLVKVHVHNTKAIYGNRKTVRQIGYSYPPEVPEEHGSVRSLQGFHHQPSEFGDHNAVHTSYGSHYGCHSQSSIGGDSAIDPMVRRFNRGSPKKTDKENSGGNLESRIKSLEEFCSANFKKLFSILETTTPKTTKSPPTSPRKVKCYSCQEEGHYSYDCPKRTSGILKKGSPTSSPSRNQDNKSKVAFAPLNKTG